MLNSVSAAAHAPLITGHPLGLPTIAPATGAPAPVSAMRASGGTASGPGDQSPERGLDAREAALLKPGSGEDHTAPPTITQLRIAALRAEALESPGTEGDRSGGSDGPVSEPDPAARTALAGYSELR